MPQIHVCPLSQIPSVVHLGRLGMIIAGRLPSVPRRVASGAGGLSRYVGDVLRNEREVAANTVAGKEVG